MEDREEMEEESLNTFEASIREEFLSGKNPGSKTISRAKGKEIVNFL